MSRSRLDIDNSSDTGGCRGCPAAAFHAALSTFRGLKGMKREDLPSPAEMVSTCTPIAEQIKIWKESGFCGMRDGGAATGTLFGGFFKENKFYKLKPRTHTLSTKK